MLAKLLKRKGLDNIAITYVNNDYGKGFADALKRPSRRKAARWRPRRRMKTTRPTTAPSSVRSPRPAPTCSSFWPMSTAPARRSSGRRWKAATSRSSPAATAWSAIQLVKAIGEGKLDGFIATKIGRSETPGTAKYAELAKAAGLDPAASFGPQAYDAAFLIALAIEKNGSDSREGVNKALREVSSDPGEPIYPGEWEKAVKLIKEGKDINYEGASGSQEFDEAGDVPGVIIEMVVEGPGFKEVGQVN